MTEDYLKYWNMTKSPFALTPDPEMLYLSTQHSECLMRLKYAIFSHKGGALLVSDNAGNGKTSILAKLKKDLDEYYAGRVKVVFIDHPTLSPIEMLGEIGNQLGTDLQTTEKIRALNSLRDRLFSFYNENIKVIVIVDEGQMLRDRRDLLDELRILLNFCVSDSFLLTFIFSGQKPLDSVLRDMPEFWQRLPVRYFLKNLNYNDTKALIKFRLKQVGASEDIFKDEAFDGIYNYSEGCPRVICAVADLCLIVGFAKGIKRIGFVEVSTACRDMESSGDGFHYYAYLKAQQIDMFSETETSNPSPVIKPSVSMKKPEKIKKPSGTAANTIVCPKCAEENAKENVTCEKCGAPLYTKCPKCLTLSETFTNECPVCHSNFDKERKRNTDELRAELKPLDILEGGYGVWLQANNIEIEGDESVIAIFPKGNFLTKGPSVTPMIYSDEGPKTRCSIVLTDKRFFISFDDKMVSSELPHIDSCMISDTGNLLVRKNLLLMNFKGGKYKITMPYGAGKSRKIFDKISTYIQSVMLK
ncbi:AAA family ATPase [Candidatus Latescibacterota bacterium]